MTIQFAPVFGIIGLVVVFLIYQWIKKQPAGTDVMIGISTKIHEGAMAYLAQQYMVLSIFIVFVFLCLTFFLPQNGLLTAVAYLSGALCSLLAGFIGMQAATKANVRTAWGANQSGQGKALSIAFFGGSVMGLAVASLGLLGLSIFFNIFQSPSQASIINGFAMGASSIALFMRVGGGIYTKAADVGADLVGKVEAGIPEDDPRNPAVIADNVGDNVGELWQVLERIFSNLCRIGYCRPRHRGDRYGHHEIWRGNTREPDRVYATSTHAYSCRSGQFDHRRVFNADTEKHQSRHRSPLFYIHRRGFVHRIGVFRHHLHGGCNRPLLGDSGGYKRGNHHRTSD